MGKKELAVSLLRGFTLVELLVVLLMISIIGGIAFGATKRGGEVLALDRTAHKVAQDARRAGQMALRGEPFACPVGNMIGYGIYFNEDTPGCYLIYAECDNVSFYDGIDCEGAGAGLDKPIEIIVLEQGVRIGGVLPLSSGEVLFIPPKPRLQINGNEDPSASIKIVLSLASDSSERKTIIIRQKGAIEIQ